MKICSKIIIAIAILIGYMSCSNNQGNERISSKMAKPNEQVSFKEPEIISTTVVEVYSDNTPKVIMVTFKDNTKMWFRAYEGSVLYVLAPREGKYFGEVTIPSKVNVNGKDYHVTDIYNEAFWNAEITSVTIPGSVKIIETGAFGDCSQLTSVVFMEGVKEIGRGTFDGCTSLTAINIPKSVTEIGELAFRNCTNLTSITIPQGVKNIRAYTFLNCAKLTSVDIPQSVTTIYEEAFKDCSNLTSIIIPKSIEWVKSEAFHGTGWYNKHSDGLMVLGHVVYGYKGEAPRGTVVVIPNTATIISDYAFYRSYGINSVKIPNSIINIGSRAFEGTTWFENQPDGLIRIGDAIYTYKGEIPRGASVNIPEGVTRICSYAFHERYDLATVTLPNSVTSIGRGAFKGCSNLASINIPKGVTCIEDETFSGCESLTEIIIPNSVTAIGVSAFHNCRMLPEITIPSSVTAIGDGAFWYCDELTSVIIQNPNLQIDFEKVFEGCEKLQRSNVIYASGSGSASNPSSVSTPTSAKSKVYSNAYDGFVNIRQAPQSKAPILGVLRNGPEGAILLGTEGEWKKIDCNGIVGYVYEKYVQDTPTEVFHGE